MIQGWVLATRGVEDVRVERRHLEFLRTIDEQGSVSAAARALYLSQPAASSQLRRLETAFGSSLFTRTASGVTATQVGREVLDVADDVLGGFAHLDGLGDTPGELVVAANTSAYLGALLSEITRRIPDRRVRCITDLSTTVVTGWLLAGDAAMAMVGVVPGHDADPPHGVDQVVFVERERFVVVLGAEHPLADEPEVTISDLRTTPWLLPPEEPDGFVAALHGAFDAAGYVPHAPVGANDLSQFADVIAHHGYVALAAPTFLPPAGVVTVPVSDDGLVGSRVIRWRPDLVDTAEVQAFTDAAVEMYEHRMTVVGQQRWWSRTPQHQPATTRPVIAPRRQP